MSNICTADQIVCEKENNSLTLRSCRLLQWVYTWVAERMHCQTALTYSNVVAYPLGIDT